MRDVPTSSAFSARLSPIDEVKRLSIRHSSSSMTSKGSCLNPLARNSFFRSQLRYLPQAPKQRRRETSFPCTHHRAYALAPRKSGGIMSYRINRRAFLGGAASAITWATLPFYARAATTTNLIRVEWQTFVMTPHYAPFLNAVRTMQANTNAADPNSWQYWTNVHANYCPHKQPYFLAWHRGYLYYLERQIRLVSGDVGFTLPYWDWFT